MSHGLQVKNEIDRQPAGGFVLIQLNTTKYFDLYPPSNWDSVYGIWFYIEAFTVGAGNLVVTLQGAVDKNQTVWTDIGAGVNITGGTAAAPIQTTFQRSPLEVAAASQKETLPPYLRLKMVTPAGATAGICKVNRTIRGLV